MSAQDYLALLDWTARQPVDGKRGAAPVDTPVVNSYVGVSRQ